MLQVYWRTIKYQF